MRRPTQKNRVLCIRSRSRNAVEKTTRAFSKTRPPYRPSQEAPIETRFRQSHIVSATDSQPFRSTPLYQMDSTAIDSEVLSQATQRLILGPVFLHLVTDAITRMISKGYLRTEP